MLDIINLSTNTTINAKIKEIKDEIPSTTNLAITAALNAKINEVKNKIPNVTSIAVTAVENEIPEHSNYITNPEFIKLAAEHFTGRLAKPNLASKNGIANFVKTDRFL